jgi:hypothetical protein
MLLLTEARVPLSIHFLFGRLRADVFGTAISTAEPMLALIFFPSGLHSQVTKFLFPVVRL